MASFPVRGFSVLPRRSRTATGILLLAATTFGLAILPIGAQQSNAPTGSQGRQATFADQLLIGLKARTAADRAFVKAVVFAVQQGKLPRRLVDSTFLWARGRAKHRSGKRELRPMIYFRPALVLRARRLGVKL